MTARKRRVAGALLAAAMLLALAACQKAEDPNLATLEKALELMYTRPNPKTEVALEMTGGDEDPPVPPPIEEVNRATEKMLEANLAGLVAEDYYLYFWTHSMLMFEPAAWNTNASVVMKQLDATPQEDEPEVYRYTVTVRATNDAGEESTHEATGSARFNDDGLIENVNPHGVKHIYEAMGMRVTPG